MVKLLQIFSLPLISQRHSSTKLLYIPGTFNYNKKLHYSFPQDIAYPTIDVANNPRQHCKYQQYLRLINQVEYDPSSPSTSIDFQEHNLCYYFAYCKHRHEQILSKFNLDSSGEIQVFNNFMYVIVSYYHLKRIQ